MNSTYIVFDIADYFCVAFVCYLLAESSIPMAKVTMVNLARQKHNLDPSYPRSMSVKH